MSTNEFNIWHDQVYVSALREAAEALIVANVTDEDAAQATSEWLNARADKIERGELHEQD